MNKTYSHWYCEKVIDDLEDYFSLPTKKVTEINFRSADGRVSTSVQLDENDMRSLVAELAECFGIEAVVKAACGK